MTALALDSMNNLYLGTLTGIYCLMAGTTKVEKVAWGDYVIYTLAIDHQNNLYFTNNNRDFYSIALSTSENTSSFIKKLNESIYTMEIDQDDNVYYCSFLDGVYFLKKGTNQVIKTNLFGREVQTIAIDHNANIIVENDEGSFIFQVFKPPVFPPPAVKEKNMVVARVLGYVFLGTSGAVGMSCLGTYLWNKYRYKKNHRK